MSLLASLREADRSAYLSVLLAPAEKRDDLAALSLYGVELARIPLTVTEPAAGEIRLQWWAEVAGGQRDGEGRGHPVGAAILDAIERHELPREPLVAMAEARSRDLYHDPMLDRDEFEAYSGATASVPIQAACRVLDPDAAHASADAAGHAGVYATVIDRLSTLARDRASGRSFLPEDVMLKAWVTPDELTDPGFGTGEGGERRAMELVGVILDFADDHLSMYRAAAQHLPGTLVPAFASVEARRVTERSIRRMGAELLRGPPPHRPIAEQRAVMAAGRCFSPGPGLLGRLRERLRR